MKVLIACGGTGGHIYPGIAIAQEFTKHNHEVFFIGAENKMETKCKKAFGKGRSKRERAGIKSGERHFTRKIQTAFCPRRRLFPRPPFCGKAHPEKPCAECLTRV